MEAKRQALLAILRPLGKALVAFAGGLDSTLLLHAAREAAAETAIKTVCDYVQLKVGEHSRMPHSSWTVGRYEDGQLFITRVAHSWALDRYGDTETDAPRLHDHV